MTELITKYNKGDVSYEMLEKAATILTATSKKGIRYYVDDTYFDYGQNWVWTTILADDPNSYWGSYQALCPRDHEKIILSDDLLATIVEIKADKDWRD